MKFRMTWMRRLLLPLAISAFAIAGVACGDDGEELTLEEYFREVDALDKDSTVRIDAVFGTLTDDSDVDQLRDAFGQFTDVLDDIVPDVDDVNPPSEVEDEHDALVASLEDVIDAANDAEDAAADAETVEEFNTAIESEEFLAANGAVTTACVNLQRVAEDNGIDVTLDCAEGEGDDSAAAVEQVIRDGIESWNGKDTDAFLGLFTDKGVSELFGEGEPVTREDVAAGLPNFIGDPPLELRELSTEADGETGQAEVVWVSDPFLEHIRFSMIQEEGVWKIDAQDYLDIEDLPAGTTLVSVDVSEFAFDVVAADITSANASGPIGFDINNVGAQQHHFALTRLPAEGDIQELLMIEEEVPGMEFVGFTEPIEPGDRNRAFVLIDSLEPGRYAMVCFLPDTTEGEDGTPHAFKGMTQEFKVE